MPDSNGINLGALLIIMLGLSIVGILVFVFFSSPVDDEILRSDVLTGTDTADTADAVGNLVDGDSNGIKSINGEVPAVGIPGQNELQDGIEIVSTTQDGLNSGAEARLLPVENSGRKKGAFISLAETSKSLVTLGGFGLGSIILLIFLLMGGSLLIQNLKKIPAQIPVVGNTVSRIKPTNSDKRRPILITFMELKERKSSVIRKLNYISNKKRQLLEKVNDIFNDIKNIPKNDIPYLLDTNSAYFKSLQSDKENLSRLLSFEHNLKEFLKSTLQLEHNIQENCKSFVDIGNRHTGRSINALYNNTLETVVKIKNYFDLKEEQLLERIDEFLGPKFVEKRITEKWQSSVKNDLDTLKLTFKDDLRLLEDLNILLHKEKSSMQGIYDDLSRIKHRFNFNIINKDTILKKNLNYLKARYDRFSTILTHGVNNQKELHIFMSSLYEVVNRILIVNRTIEHTEMDEDDQIHVKEFNLNKANRLKSVLIALRRVEVFLEKENLIDKWVNKFKEISLKADPEIMIKGTSVEIDERWISELSNFNPEDMSMRNSRLSIEIHREVSRLHTIYDRTKILIDNYLVYNKKVKEKLADFINTLDLDKDKLNEFVSDIVASNSDFEILKEIGDKVKGLIISNNKAQEVKGKLCLTLNMNGFNLLLQKIDERNRLYKKLYHHPYLSEYLEGKVKDNI